MTQHEYEERVADVAAVLERLNDACDIAPCRDYVKRNTCQRCPIAKARAAVMRDCWGYMHPKGEPTND